MSPPPGAVESRYMAPMGATICGVGGCGPDMFICSSRCMRSCTRSTHTCRAESATTGAGETAMTLSENGSRLGPHRVGGTTAHVELEAAQRPLRPGHAHGDP